MKFAAPCNYLCDVYYEQQNEECFSLKDAYCDVKQESPKKEDKGYVKISFLAGDDKDTPPEERKDYVQYTMKFPANIWKQDNLHKLRKKLSSKKRQR